MDTGRIPAGYAGLQPIRGPRTAGRRRHRADTGGADAARRGPGGGPRAEAEMAVVDLKSRPVHPAPTDLHTGNRAARLWEARTRRLYWQLTALGLAAHFAGWPAALPLVLALNSAQVLHVLAARRSFRPLDVQVRIGYLGLLALGSTRCSSPTTARSPGCSCCCPGTGACRCRGRCCAGCCCRRPPPAPSPTDCRSERALTVREDLSSRHNCTRLECTARPQLPLRVG